MLGIGDDPIPPPGPEARTGRASSENKAIAVTARFMDFLLFGGLWTHLVQPQLWRSQESVNPQITQMYADKPFSICVASA
jgi:hypothetical protein